MGLKDWMFRSKENTFEELSFGRYSDLYKNEQKKVSWDKALQSSEQGDYMSVYRHFIDYISDDEHKNVEVLSSDKDHLSFMFYQGSKKVHVKLDNDFITAEVKIVRCNQANLEVFRSLLEENHRLKYSKFCLDKDKYLVMEFQSSHLDANPYKLYYGLKEMSTIADHKDDALTEKYKEFEAVNTEHVKSISSYLLRAKFEYFNQEITKLTDLVNANALTSRENLGSLAFLVNAFVYKMDYLLAPEGRMMQKLDRLIELSNTDSTLLYQNASEIMHLLDLLQNKKEADLKHEFYHSIHTFGVTSPIDHDFVINFIESNLESLEWYLSKRQYIFSDAVCSFVIGKLLYDYALPFYDKSLAHLFFRVTEPLFFGSIGEKGLVKNSKIKKSEVLKCLEEIEENARKKGVLLTLNKSKLKWDKHSFGPSFLDLMLHINPINL